MFHLLLSSLMLFGIPKAAAAEPPATKVVVLVHGAFADGSSWEKVIPLLQAKGLGAEPPRVERNLADGELSGERLDVLGDLENGLIALPGPSSDAEVGGDDDHCRGCAGAADVDADPDGLAVLDVSLAGYGVPGTGR